MKTMLTAFSLFTATLLASAVEPAEFKIGSLKAGEWVRDDCVKFTSEEGVVVFDIHDAQGIGGVSITPKSGDWPKSVIVRLHLPGLESLQLSAGKVTLFGSVLSHSGHKRLLEIDEAGKKREAGRDDPLWINIRMLDGHGKDINHLPDPGKGGCFEVTLPPALLIESNLGMTLRWIDFYRH